MKYKLGELVKIKYGKNQKKVQSENGTIPIYGTGGLMGYGTAALYDKPSVLIGRKGSINKVRYVDHPFWTVDTLFYTEVNEQLVIPKFLYYLMSLLNLDSYNEGTTIPSLRTETLNLLEFEIPPIEEQKKIASVLSALDDKIELNNAINKNLEQQAQAIFKNIYSVQMPLVSLSSIAILKYGKGMPTKNLCEKGYPVFGGNGIIGYHPNYMYELPQILISCRGAASGNILESYPKSFITNNSLILELNDRRYYEFIKYYFLQNKLYQFATGSAQPQITIDNIKDIRLPYPSFEEIESVCSQLNILSKAQFQNKMQNDKLAELRDSLLPRLMSGELDVSALDF